MGWIRKKHFERSAFFSYIRLRRVILLRSDIVLRTAIFASRVWVANIISLSRSENITPTKSEYHYITQESHFCVVLNFYNPYKKQVDLLNRKSTSLFHQHCKARLHICYEGFLIWSGLLQKFCSVNTVLQFLRCCLCFA